MLKIEIKMMYFLPSHLILEGVISLTLSALIICFLLRKQRGHQRWKLELEPLMHLWMNGWRLVPLTQKLSQVY